jgi:hypothetical protein
MLSGTGKQLGRIYARDANQVFFTVLKQSAAARARVGEGRVTIPRIRAQEVPGAKLVDRKRGTCLGPELDPKITLDPNFFFPERPCTWLS